MDIQIVRGADADSLLRNDSFNRDWDRLWEQCPWATAFQTRGFSQTWYGVYRQSCEPLLAIQQTADGQTEGLLALAVNEQGKLRACGMHQSEYQTWLCRPDRGDEFGAQALNVLRDKGLDELKLKFVPAQSPRNCVNQADSGRLTLLTPFRRPMLIIGDGTDIEDSLKKSGNKSRLRQLKKIGPVQFRQISEPTQIQALLETAIGFYDQRHLEQHKSAPFATDLLKKLFHSALTRVPGLMHVTALTVGDTLASMQMNVISRKQLHLWFISHNPELERLSPGKLHILMLARMMKEQGLEELDLTPGGEEYKERFANAWDEVYELDTYASTLGRIAGAAVHTLEAVAKGCLAVMRTTARRAAL